jgi:hypothetical protein
LTSGDVARTADNLQHLVLPNAHLRQLQAIRTWVWSNLEEFTNDHLVPGAPPTLYASHLKAT